MMRMGCIAAATLALVFMSSAARADNRMIDGLMGAGAGALVAGPVGLVAGGVIGYSAGPNISCSLRDDCHRRHHRRHRHY